AEVVLDDRVREEDGGGRLQPGALAASVGNEAQRPVQLLRAERDPVDDPEARRRGVEEVDLVSLGGEGEVGVVLRAPGVRGIGALPEAGALRYGPVRIRALPA